MLFARRDPIVIVRDFKYIEERACDSRNIEKYRDE